ncbi:MAG: hypothetical protein KC912_05610 [Proteobacteria bacterium]|nr:hypothetical protein [Pseudomonadota bacterium]
MTPTRFGGLVALVASLSTPAFASDCGETFSNSALDEQLDEAMLAFASLDEAGFMTAATRSAVMVPCVDAPMTPSLAAAYHRVHSVRFFVSAQKPEALGSLRSAFGIDSSATLSTRIAPEGGALFRLQEEALANPGRRNSSLEVPDGYDMMVDGDAGNDVSKDGPHIVQLLDDGKLSWSGVVPAGGSLPAEFSAAVTDLDPVDLGGPAVGADAIADLDEPTGRAPREKKQRTGGGGPNKTLLMAAGGSAVAAAGLFGVAAVTRGSFNNDPTAGKYHVTNGTYWGSVGFGGAALVLGGVSFLGDGR